MGPLAAKASPINGTGSTTATAVYVHDALTLSKAKLKLRQALLQRLRSVNGDPQQVGGMKSNALLAWGPIHDNQVGIPHNVDDDADSLAVNLSHIIADFEALHGTALVMLNSRISCIHSSGLGLKASVVRRSSAMAFVDCRWRS
jgi:hypothetical protein